MATPIEDFLITLGFDTSKIKSQVDALHAELNKLAVNVDAKRVKQGLATQNTLASNELKTAKDTAKAKEKIATDSANKLKKIKDSIDPKSSKPIVHTPKPTVKQTTTVDKKVDITAQTIASTRKQAALRVLRNQIAEYERSVGGPSNASNRYKYYERGNASIAKIQAYTEELRGKNTDIRNRMKAEGSLKSFDSASSSKAEMDMLKASNAIEVLRVRMQRLGMDTKQLDKNLIDSKDLNALKKLYEQTNTQVKKEIELNKGKVKALKETTKLQDAQVKAYEKHLTQQARMAKQAADRQARADAKKPTSAYINQLMSNYGVGSLGKYDAPTQRLLQQQAMKQSSQGASRAYLNAAGDIQKYQRLDPNRVQSALASGSVIEIRAAQKELARMNAELERTRRHAIGASAAFSSMHDSTRNMVREYASLYALFSATNAIKENAKAVDGMKAGLTAVTDSTEEAAAAQQFLRETILKNGLSLKDAGKDYIKLKASIGDKLSDVETNNIFTSLAQAGVVFQLSQDDMTGTIRAVSQMFSKGKITAKFFGPFSRN